jgi:hypothetical protein
LKAFQNVGEVDGFGFLFFAIRLKLQLPGFTWKGSHLIGSDPDTYSGFLVSTD